jgi:hypothetical protein
MHAAITTLNSSPSGNKAHQGHASSVKQGLNFQWRIDNMVTLVSEAMCEKPQALDLTLPRYASHTVTCVQCKPACTMCLWYSFGMVAVLAELQSHSLCNTARNDVMMLSCCRYDWGGPNTSYGMTAYPSPQLGPHARDWLALLAQHKPEGGTWWVVSMTCYGEGGSCST